ncbi:chloride intracellular channel exc-4 [Coccinella septempunctata]|uniref:chloride intracellular channel exc-4 n=1 Tax=Coccinella septempunctata TaxID=41139 RepID=UPI001D08F3A4|nr:chloride intracellular channel exc-4 [Coccinella septempunctata]
MSDEIVENGHDENGDVPEIELIIRASTIDGRRKGACLFCHEYFMELYLLAELKTISLKVTTVDMQKPPPDFRTNFEATPPPILIDRGLAILENEKIERHIMKNVPGGHNLFVQDKEVATLIENLYTKFKIYITKYESTDTTEASQPLLSQLMKINDFLAKRATRFLTGDTMSCFDCELMPRLQHIRIGAKAFRNFEIPTKFSALWRYMSNMYELEAFRQSCPADQDIISHIKNQLGLRTKARIELETPIYSTSIPILNDA